MAVNITGPIDPNDANVQPLLEDLQGNILKGHRRNYTIHLFLRFLPTPEGRVHAKQWIQRLADQSGPTTQEELHITSARTQRVRGNDGYVFVNFFFSYKGYEALEVQPVPEDAQFQKGMKHEDVREDLVDPEYTQWEPPYQDDSHACILLAHNDPMVLNAAARQIDEEVGTFAVIVTQERGNVWRNNQGQPIEHFGFADGVSQPLFFVDDINKARQDQGIPDPVPHDIDGLPTMHDPAAPPSLVLVRDFGGQHEDSYGSYLVYRKLEQNVRDFTEKVMELSSALGHNDLKLAGALVIGRFKDGTPVTLYDTDGHLIPNPAPHGRPIVPNSSTYRHEWIDGWTDRAGTRCPLSAHIRQVNPRVSTANNIDTVEERRNRRIVRRGITYGDRTVHPKDDAPLAKLPCRDVGLLFMCFQSDIKRQFEHLQKEWANNTQIGAGIDPLIGQSRDPQLVGQPWPPSWDTHNLNTDSWPRVLFHNFVTLKGGEYFFAPSISTLSSL